MFDASRYRNGGKCQVPQGGMAPKAIISGIMSAHEFVSILRDPIAKLHHDFKVF
jgi:hypothetical protein